MASKRAARYTLVSLLLAGSLIAGGTLVRAADPRLDEALQTLEKAQGLVEAAQSDAASPKIDHRFQRHADRAIELINRAMAQIELAKAVADSGFDAAE